MVGFGKIMHLEVTKMTDGSTIKLVEALVGEFCLWKWAAEGLHFLVCDF